MNQTDLTFAIAVLVWACVVTLSAAALTVILRNAPVIRGWVQEAKKPWACNICMPLYTCGALVAGLCAWHREWHWALVFAPAYILTKVFLDQLSKAPSEVPLMLHPDLPADSDDPKVTYEEADLTSSDLEDISALDTDTDPNAMPAVLRTNRKV